MQEATGTAAGTLHRLLEYCYDEDAFNCYFRRNEENPLEADAVIVDEVSMLDVFLFHNLLRALKEGARLSVGGDADQLPSVGPGNVMRDIIESGVVPDVYKRQIASHDTLTQNGIMSLSSIEGYKKGADVEDVYQDFYNLGKIFQVEDLSLIHI